MAKQFGENNFDLLRLLAASQVMLAHGVLHLLRSKPSWWPLLEAFPGVPAFFAISGFLISASYERSSSLASYARNRVLRIFPGLWCCILLTIPVALWLGIRFPPGAGSLWFTTQLTGLIYTPAFLRGLPLGSYNGALWTIPLELQFYCVLPLLYWIARSTRRPTTLMGVVAIIFLASAFAFTALTLNSPLEAETRAQALFRYSFVPHFYLFMTGVLLQRWQVHRSGWVAGRAHYWLLAYAACYFLAPASATTYLASRLLLAVLVISAAYTLPGLARKVLQGQDISYGVYIYHGLLLNIFLHFNLIARERALVWLAGLTCVLATLSWVCVERRFLRKKAQSIHPTEAAGISVRHEQTGHSPAAALRSP